MDNIPVAHGLPSLIHTLTTLHRERLGVSQLTCSATTGMFHSNKTGASAVRVWLRWVNRPSKASPGTADATQDYPQ